MMFPSLRVKKIDRAEGVSDRLVAVTLFARFFDELLSGLPLIVMPLIRSQLGLSYVQVSLLSLTVEYVSAPVEFLNGFLIDLWKRPWLMAWGSAAIGIATVFIGIAPSFLLLIAGFAIYALGSGPLAHTSDVVLVEAFPEEPNRIYSRATLIDTFGALLAPAILTTGFWLDLNWRWLTVSLGLIGPLYSYFILRTRFPLPKIDVKPQGKGRGHFMLSILKTVATTRRARIWLLFLFVFSIVEVPQAFAAIWLRETANFSRVQIGMYVILQMVVSIVSLIHLDSWLSRSSYRRILLIAGCTNAVIYPIWILLPNPAAKFLLAVPINFLFAVFWPIARAQSLISVPGRGGVITSVDSVLALAPIPLLFGLLAESITLTWAMVLVTTAGLIAMLVLTTVLVSDEGGERIADD